ncbi:MAG: hypothetical protein C0613_14890 [Desulfobulbaceae bacterium]|nr:MAG: hypothetical protein C0613_14890 [Desulfobulbaceae bacterium]
MSEENIDQLSAQDSKQEAVKQLYEMIVAAARNGDFAGAETLRLKLIATDDMALSEIIGSAEVIEAAKAAAIDSSFHEQWPELCASLSEEEVNALYFSLKEVALQPGQAFVEQGKLNNRLFFLCQGRAGIVCRHGDRQVLLHQLGPGDIAGDDTFFGISVCTNSVLCQSPVIVKYLERHSLDDWRDEVPGLEAKLQAYCQERARLDYARTSKNIDRRRHRRYPLEVEVHARLQNLQGQDIGASFRGVLDDVSAGGLCFYIKCSRQSTARMLLGRPVALSFTLGKATLDLRGVIVSSKYQLLNDYTVHVKITNADHPLFQQLLQKLEARAAKGG